jgi:hypothetical protein
MPPPPYSSGGGATATATALFDNDGEGDELSFLAGDVLKLLGRADEDTLRVELRGRTGTAPLSYLLVHQALDSSMAAHPLPDAAHPPALPPRPHVGHVLYGRFFFVGKPHGVVRSDFTAENEGELEARAGETVVLVNYVNDDWIMVSGRWTVVHALA